MIVAAMLNSIALRFLELVLKFAWQALEPAVSRPSVQFV